MFEPYTFQSGRDNPRIYIWRQPSVSQDWAGPHHSEHVCVNFQEVSILITSIETAKLRIIMPVV